MKKRKPNPKGKKVTCSCHGYAANAETAHVPVLWEDVWIKFRGRGKHDLRKLGPCFSGMDDVQSLTDTTKSSIADVAKALNGDLRRHGRLRSKEELLALMAEYKKELLGYETLLRTMAAGEVVFDANDEQTPNIPNIYMPVARMTRKDLEAGVVYYLRRLGFATPPRLKWVRTGTVFWGC